MDGIILQREPVQNVDSDSDGLPDFWEQNFFDDPKIALPESDPDKDGFANFQEWLTGSNPTEHDSFFRIESIEASPPSAGIQISWHSLADRIYDVQSTRNLTAGFTDLATDLAATPPMNFYVDISQHSIRQTFYRIRVRHR